jgi:ferredoxin
MKDGYLNICKDCVIKRMTEYRINNHETILEKDRIRGRKAEAVERRREYYKKLRSQNPDFYKQRDAKYLRKSREKFPEKNIARQRLERAVKLGTIERPDVCSACGKKCKPDAHHRDYSKPFEVVWLCNTCHAKEHRIEATEYRRAL